MNFKNYYKVLGVSASSGEDEIKKAYRELAKKWHPDKNQGNNTAEENFKEISEAYDVLSDVLKRKKFDDFVKASQQHRAYSYTSKTTYSQTEYETEFSDFFKQFFKNKRKKRSYFKGEDIRGKITIDLKEAYLGSVRIINTSEGKIRIKIKPGISSEKIIKVSGKGKKSKYGGDNGDLFIRIVVKNSHEFARKGNDVIQKTEIDIYTAILGGKISLKTIKGDVKITIPENYNYKKKLRLKGYGMPVYDKPKKFGDLYLDLKYKIPKDISEEEKQLLKKLRDLQLKKSGKNT
ncbi:MAG: J domain-containing protein [Bacteroidetes bacterium]|nr:MAG: J domain-containing protein [Bacteroidota bacterium]